MNRGETTQVVAWVERLTIGDDSAFNELLIHFEARLLRLTRKRLKTFPAVRRWEQTDDVFQAAAIRLRNALKDVTPRSTRDFIGLAALQVRRERTIRDRWQKARLVIQRALDGRLPGI
jgi:hypothetical protein